jgi:hypothetical protein
MEASVRLVVIDCLSDKLKVPEQWAAKFSYSR